MPVQVLPTLEDFKAFNHKILFIGYRAITRGEVATDFKRLGLSPPRSRSGREIGYIFSAKGYDAVVWTTFLLDSKTARKSDAGHVLIKKGDLVLYHFHPTHRTKNFLKNLLMKANIAKERVLCRPLCPKCHAFMDIKQGKGLKSRYYQCSNGHDKVNASWDKGMNPQVLKDVEKLRRRREAYKKQLRREGKKPGAAMLKRKCWATGKPKNKI